MDRNGEVLGNKGSNLEDFIGMFAFPVCIDFSEMAEPYLALRSLQKWTEFTLC